MNRRRKPLTFEDKILWSRVARTAVPLEGKAYPVEPDVSETPEIQINKTTQLPSKKQQPEPILPKVKLEPTVRKMDLPTRHKLARERLEIEARVDLHGLTQDQAYFILLNFLQRAHQNNKRHVLVITGKGTSSIGVLKRAVPQWISSPPFKVFVSSYEDAARHHGGEGALYIKLRKKVLKL